MKTSETITAIATALAKAQGAIKPAVKDATNPYFKSRYADLSSVWEAIRQPLSSNGICVLQEAIMAEKLDVSNNVVLAGVAVRTRLLHTSGEWIEFDALTVPLGKSDAHGVGSAATYARRYALSAALGIVADEDDDGNGVVQRNGAARTVTNELPQPVKPGGFDEWLGMLMATSMTGAEPLRKAWESSPMPLRRYLTSTDNARWEKIKKVAQDIETAVTK